QHSEVEADPAQDQGRHVDAVEEHEERGHPRGDVAPPHARAPQRPRRQCDAAGAAGGEQPRRGVARERDLGARPHPDPRPGVGADRAEEHDVAEKRDRLEDERGEQPAAVAVREPPPGVGSIGQRREQHEQRSRRDAAHGEQHDRPAARESNGGFGCARRIHPPIRVAAGGPEFCDAVPSRHGTENPTRSVSCGLLSRPRGSNDMAVVSTPYTEKTDEQKAICEMVRQFADEQIIPAAEHYDAADVYPEPIVEQLKELGLFGVTIPEEYGGMGLDLTTYAMIVEELSRGWISISGIVNTHFIGSYLLM